MLKDLRGYEATNKVFDLITFLSAWSRRVRSMWLRSLQKWLGNCLLSIILGYAVCFWAFRNHYVPTTEEVLHIRVATVLGIIFDISAVARNGTSTYIYGTVKGNGHAIFTALPVRMRWRLKLEKQVQNLKSASRYRPSINPPANCSTLLFDYPIFLSFPHLTLPIHVALW